LAGSLADIASISREVVESMSDIVWMIDPERDQLRDLSSRMRRFVTDVLSSPDMPLPRLVRPALPHKYAGQISKLGNKLRFRNLPGRRHNGRDVRVAIIEDVLCAGACGYLLKNTPPARLLESIKEITSSGAAMLPEVARRVVDLFQQIQPSVPDHDLTLHEMRLLKVLVAGHNYQTAAAGLKVGVNTIRFHMRSVYSKLEVHSKAEAVSKALRSRIIR
jgi:DNA-binding CsgD family transcriptional regulator